VSTPQALRTLIAAELGPVRPLASPVRRALWLVPFAVVLLFAASAVFSIRADAPRLGWALTWGLSALEMTLGLALIAAALREAVPGTLLPRRGLAAAFAGTAAVVIAVTWITWTMSGSRLEADPRGFVWRVCVAGTVISALPPLMLSAVLVARAYPLRPAVAGALYGLGSAILADAGWRVFCHFANPAHVFGAHTSAAVLVTVVGVAVGTLAQRRRARR
jgi:hypothetical protein